MNENKPTNPNRQHLSGNSVEEARLRGRDVRDLIDNLVGRHEEYFADPENRIDFLLGTTPDSFLNMAQYINAKLRSEKPRLLRLDVNERGGGLPALHTPAVKDKPESFRKGFEEIQNYLRDSDDDIERKIEGAAMATEALIIWVHPFNDGNGRTSRFMANMIEEGVSNTPELISQTVDSKNRGTDYRIKRSSREGLLSEANNIGIMLDDEERDEIRQQADSSPADTEAIPLSIHDLLNNDTIRQDVRNRRDRAKSFRLHQNAA